MKTPIDFGKDFLYKLYDQRDADACQKMLAGDLVWITPENMHHFLSDGAVLKFLRKQVKSETESRYVDVISIKSSPSADNIMTVAYEINLVSREEEKPLYLRCSMVICRRTRRLEITFLHFSGKTERDSSEQLRDFVANLPCGVMILACLDGRREEAIFYNAYFAGKLRYKQEEFARAMAQNPFFMTSEEDRDRIHEQIAEARKNGGSITANLRFYRRDGNSFYYRMKGAPAYQADGGTVFYCVFQETTSFQMTADRLQSRLDTATEILRQIPEALCGIEYPAHVMAEKAEQAAAAKGADSAVQDLPEGNDFTEDDGDVRVYRTKGGRNAQKSAAAQADTKVNVGAKTDMKAAGGAKTDTKVIAAQQAAEDLSGTKVIAAGKTAAVTAAAVTAAAAKPGAVKITGSGPRVFFTSKNIPSMFGVSNSMYMKNILLDPFYGLEITSITRERLMSSFILNPDKTATGKAVSCGIFRIKRPDRADDKAIRVELMIRRVKEKDGTMRLYLFYFDREAAQQEMENRVDKAMKMGRAGKEQLRSDLRKAKENAARRQSELTAAMKEAEQKYAGELSRIENSLADEKKRSVLMSRQLEESKSAQKQIAAERDRIEEDASRRIRNYEARAQRQVSEACSARDLLEEQLRESQERSRALEQQLQKEKSRRILLEEQYRQLQEQNEELQKEHKEGQSPYSSSVKITDTLGAAMLTAAVQPGAPAMSSPAGPAGAGQSFMPVYPAGPGRPKAKAETGAAAEAADPGYDAAGGPGGRKVLKDTVRPAAAGGREGDWMTQTQSLTVFSAMDPGRGSESGRESSSASGGVSSPASGRKSTPAPGRVLSPESGRESSSASGGVSSPASGRKSTPAPGRELTPASGRTALSAEEALRPESFSPEKLLRDIMMYEEDANAEKKLNLRLLIDSRLPASVIGFASLLKNALCEIIENAIGRARPGGTISVYCRADRPSGGLVNLYFRIDDNGSGIPAGGMQPVFGVGQTMDPAEAAGAGFYAAEEAAALMGGSLHASSSAGKTRFSLTVALRVQPQKK